MKKGIKDLKPGDVALVRWFYGSWRFDTVKAVTAQHGGTVILQGGDRYDLRGIARGSSNGRLHEDQSPKAHEAAQAENEAFRLNASLRDEIERVQWRIVPTATLQAVAALVREYIAPRK